MHPLDIVVLAGYFLAMTGIGVWCAFRVKAQEDFFMGGRSFGKLLQTFAAFGAGTGSSDPVNTARTTFTSGMSGMWSVMYWLFATPFYWITAVWFRRMRHLTTGDWFVERYESRGLGVAYAIFGIFFYIVYGSMLFSAIGKVAAPIIGIETISVLGETLRIENVLVPIIGFVVLIYGLAGGLRAAYVTDLVQGLCIILLSVLLVPFGLSALAERFGGEGDGMLAGFRIMHERLPEAHFSIVGSGSSSEFPLHRIIAVVIINVIGVVVQPHFIATGGGSAKNETSARVGMVVGNFLKRFCTVGWVLTALIALALYADSPELAGDPDKTWGYASHKLLGPGLTGLMLACLLAALMSSIDAYMIVGSALVVRNIYAPFVNPRASEAQYLRTARLTGVVIVGGAVVVSIWMMDVFKQLQLTWIIPVLFAAVFWTGLYWRRATTRAAWITVAYCALAFIILPKILPVVAPGLRDSLLDTNTLVVTTTTRPAAHSDVAQRRARIELWKQKSQGPRPADLEFGAPLTTVVESGGRAVYWSGGLAPTDGSKLNAVPRKPIGKPERIDENAVRQVAEYDPSVRLRGQGDFRLDFLLYRLLRVDLTTKSSAWLNTLELPLKIVTPFLIMIIASFLTRRNSKDALNRYYAKMKTPVESDPEADRAKLAAAYANPEALESRKLFPGTDLEFQRPTTTDIVGVVVCIAICFGVIGLAVAVASIG